MNAIKENPVTTIIGLAIALCPLVGMFIPEAKEACSIIENGLIGAGFVSAADGLRKKGGTPS